MKICTCSDLDHTYSQFRGKITHTCINNDVNILIILPKDQYRVTKVLGDTYCVDLKMRFAP